MFEALALAGLSAGGSLLQGIGAKQASAKQARLQAIADATARNENQMVLDEVNRYKQAAGQMLVDMSHPSVAVQEAEAAGFNPVTWLSAGYATRMGALSDAYKLMTPEYQLQSASQVPQQHSMLSAFGGALSAGANAFGTQYRADQSYDLQLGKLAMGLSSAFGGGSSFGGGSTMSGLTYGSSVSRGGAASGSSALSNLPYPQKWKPGDVNMTNPWFGLNVDKTFADAEAFEARYGDIAQEVAGARNLVADGYFNMFGSSVSTDWNNMWKGPEKPWSFAATPAGRVWDWMVTGKGTNREVVPYLPFPGAGAGVTYAW